MHLAFLLQLVEASQMQPMQLSLRPADAGLHWYWADTATVKRRRTAAPSIVITRWCCGCRCGGVTTPVSSAVAVLCVSTARVLPM